MFYKIFKSTSMETNLLRTDFKYDIFISYDRRDIKFVISMVHELKKFRYRIWRDEDILYKYSGEKFDKHIQEGIKNSAIFLYVHSEYSAHNEYIQKNELPWAQSEGKPILIYEHNYKYSELPENPEIGNIQRIKLLINPDIEEIDNLYSIRVAVQRRFKELTPSGNYNKLETCSRILNHNELQAFLTGEVFIWAIPENKKEELKEKGFFSEPTVGGEIYGKLMDFLSAECGGITDINAYLQEIAERTADEFIEKLDKKKNIFNGPMLGVSSIEARRSADGKEVHSLHIGMYHSDYFTFKFMSNLYKELVDANENLFNIQSVTDIPKYAPFLSSLGMGGFLVEQDDKAVKTLWVKRSDECEASNLYHFSYDETVGVKDINEEEATIDLYGTLYRGIKEELGLQENHITDQGGIFEIGVILTRTRIELELLSYIVLDSHVRHSFENKLEAADDSKLEIGEHYFWDFDEYKIELTDKILTPEALALIQRVEERKNSNSLFIHRKYASSSKIGENTTIGLNVIIEDHTIIGDRCRIGNNCKIHKNIFVDSDVAIGDNVKIQDNVMIPHGVTLEYGVFVGPAVAFTNDKFPRSITPDGKLKGGEDWKMTPTLVRKGASLGANSTIVCGVIIGEWAIVGAGAVVTKNVPDYALVVGNPAQIRGWVSKSGEKMKVITETENEVVCYSDIEKEEYRIQKAI